MKNLFKKLLASCLVVCMVLTLCVGAITVNAENPTGTVVAGTTTVDSGEGTAVVPVEVSAGVAASKVSVKVPANLTITALTLDTADEDVDVTYASAADPNGKPISLVEATEFVAPYVDAEGVFSYIIHAPAGEVTTAPVIVKISFTGTFVENAEGILVDVEAQAAPDAVVLFDLTITDGKIIVKAAHVCEFVGTVTQAPTCTVPGIKTYACTCGVGTYTEEIPVIPHTEEEIPAVPATCTTAGATAGVKCSVCQEVLTAPTATEALGHAWDEGVIDPDATCTKEGVITYTCTRCPETKTEVINVKDHTPAAETVKKDEVAATCTTDGSYRDVVVCEVCGAEISTETITVKALGHAYGTPVDNGDGTHTATCANDAAHKETAEHEYVDGECVCGAVKVVETPVDPNLKPNFTLIQLSETVNVQYIYILPKEYDDFRLEVSAKGYDAKNKFAPCDKEMRVFDTEHYTQAVPTSNYYELIYTGIGMYEMDMEVTAVLYVLKDGKEVAKSIPLTCTIAQLALESYNKNLGNTANNKKARNIAVDLLNLGSEVQKYFVKDGKAPSNSVFAKATAEHLPVDVLPEGALENNGSKEYCEFNLVDQTTGSRVMPTILMNASPAFNFVSIIDKKYDAADLTFDVTYESIHLGTCPQTLTGSQLVELGMAAPASGYYESPFDKIALYDSDKVVNFTLTYKKGSAEQNVLLTAQCTVEAYIAKNLNQGKNSDAAFDALAKFVTSAHANWPDY